MFHTQIFFLLLLSLSVAFGENSSLSNSESSSHHNSAHTFPNEFIHATSHIQSNAPCRLNVSQYNTGSNPKTVTSALQSSCSDGYEISLLDSIHYEYVTINKTKNIPQTADQAKKKVIDFFKGSSSTYRNSIYYSFVIDGKVDTNGYIDLEIAQEYCKSKTELTLDCICDTYSVSYPLAFCLRDKLCITDLIHQPIDECPCQSTADPRANDTCPAYCIRGYVTSDCICDTNLSSYPVESYCPCLATGDPRAGGVCPAYCVKGQVTSECVCDYYIPDFTIAQCQTEKKCKFDLADQTNTTCPCLTTGDPRAGYGQCPAYCTAKDQPSQSCICDSNPSAQYPPQTCQSEKKCTQSSNSTVTKDSCTCSGSNYPTGCKCPTDSSQLNGIPQNRCECLKTGDPRANGICPAYCIKGQVTANCECDINSTTYPLSNCQKEKLCVTDLINQPNTTCPCLPTGDPRAGKGQCPSYCIKDQVNESCICDTNIPGYTVAQCQIEYQCKYNLASQTNATCPCLSTSDPRAGYGQCPAYCTSKDYPSQSCVCDSNPNASYPYSTCQSEKKCNVSSSSTVTKDSCTCSGSNHPTGCRCPSETTQLTG
ncbi:MAG: hypothetical protein EZS28_013927, partial [Streblomastix strix]